LKDAQKPDHVSLNTLIGRLREGRFVIPDFQRDFEWRPSHIQDLMRSILLDYYIGSLLLWKGKKENFEALSCEPMYGHDDNGSAEYIVLDGQQRLTALYYVCFAPDKNLPNRASRYVYFVNVDKFMEEEHDDAFFYLWAPNRIKGLINNRERQFAEHIFPLSVIGTGGWELFTWIQGYEQHWTKRAEEAKEGGDLAAEERARRHVENARAFGDHIRGITEQYQVSYIELDQDIAVDKVCDIFTQINSRGVRLDIFDLINALLKPKGLQLKHMWRKVAPKLEFAETEKMNVYVLQVMSILRQAYCSPKYLYFLLPGQERQVRDPDGTRRKEVMVADTQDFERRWTKAVDALQASINLLRQPQEFGVVSPQYLPYASILPVFAALQTEVKSLKAHRQLEAQRRVRHWYWASVFLSRYSGAVESTSARDYLDIKNWLHGKTAEPWMIQEFRARFRSLNLRNETARGSSVYKGIFNLLVIRGARDWMSGNIPQHDELDDHHIVPASWGTENLSGGLVHTILNRTPLTAQTNRKVIRDRLPNTYLPELMNQNGEKAVRDLLESHFISRAALEILLRDPFTSDDFEAFIAERQRTIEDAIENLLIKERIDLPPNLRELDEKVEKVELGLRAVILSTLDGDAALLPPHVLQKADERLRKAASKNAAFDDARYEHLEGKLEFFDLRELQDAITSKVTWKHFEPCFSHKETLISKFGQLAELRNGIRHSRTVDEVTRMEGEAAVLWFEKVLGKQHTPG
jgi:hypothetical protein